MSSPSIHQEKTNKHRLSLEGSGSYPPSAIPNIGTSAISPTKTQSVLSPSQMETLRASMKQSNPALNGPLDYTHPLSLRKSIIPPTGDVAAAMAAVRGQYVNTGNVPIPVVGKMPSGWRPPQAFISSQQQFQPQSHPMMPLSHTRGDVPPTSGDDVATLMSSTNTSLQPPRMPVISPSGATNMSPSHMQAGLPMWSHRAPDPYSLANNVAGISSSSPSAPVTKVAIDNNVRQNQIRAPSPMRIKDTNTVSMSDHHPKIPQSFKQRASTPQTPSQDFVKSLFASRAAAPGVTNVIKPQGSSTISGDTNNLKASTPEPMKLSKQQEIALLLRGQQQNAPYPTIRGNNHAPMPNMTTRGIDNHSVQHATTQGITKTTSIPHASNNNRIITGSLLSMHSKPKLSNKITLDNKKLAFAARQSRAGLVPTNNKADIKQGSNILLNSVGSKGAAANIGVNGKPVNSTTKKRVNFSVKPQTVPTLEVPNIGIESSSDDDSSSDDESNVAYNVSSNTAININAFIDNLHGKKVGNVNQQAKPQSQAKLVSSESDEGSDDTDYSDISDLEQETEDKLTSFIDSMMAKSKTKPPVSLNPNDPLDAIILEAHKDVQLAQEASMTSNGSIGLQPTSSGNAWSPPISPRSNENMSPRASMSAEGLSPRFSRSPEGLSPRVSTSAECLSPGFSPSPRLTELSGSCDGVSQRLPVKSYDKVIPILTQSYEGRLSSSPRPTVLSSCDEHTPRLSLMSRSTEALVKSQEFAALGTMDDVELMRTNENNEITDEPEGTTSAELAILNHYITVAMKLSEIENLSTHHVKEVTERARSDGLDDRAIDDIFLCLIEKSSINNSPVVVNNVHDEFGIEEETFVHQPVNNNSIEFFIIKAMDLARSEKPSIESMQTIIRGAQDSQIPVKVILQGFDEGCWNIESGENIISGLDQDAPLKKVLTFNKYVKEALELENKADATQDDIDLLLEKAKADFIPTTVLQEVLDAPVFVTDEDENRIDHLKKINMTIAKENACVLARKDGSWEENAKYLLQDAKAKDLSILDIKNTFIVERQRLQEVEEERQRELEGERQRVLEENKSDLEEEIDKYGVNFKSQSGDMCVTGDGNETELMHSTSRKEIIDTITSITEHDAVEFDLVHGFVKKEHIDAKQSISREEKWGNLVHLSGISQEYQQIAESVDENQRDPESVEEANVEVAFMGNKKASDVSVSQTDIIKRSANASKSFGNGNLVMSGSLTNGKSVYSNVECIKSSSFNGNSERRGTTSIDSGGKIFEGFHQASGECTERQQEKYDVLSSRDNIPFSASFLSQSTANSAPDIDGVSAAKAFRIKKQFRRYKRIRLPITIQHQWKLPLADRVIKHSGFSKVNVQSIYDTTILHGEPHSLDPETWERREVQQSFLNEKSIDIVQNWFGTISNHRISSKAREPISHPTSVRYELMPNSEFALWDEEWYTTWRSRRENPNNLNNMNICGSKNGGDETVSSTDYLSERSSNESFITNIELPMIGTICTIRFRIGERVSRVNYQYTSSLRKSRWKKKYCPKMIFQGL